MKRVNVYKARVRKRDERQGLSVLTVGRARIFAPAWTEIGAGKGCRVSIDPGDVLLSAGPPPKVTARNVIPARVTAVKRTRLGTFVHLNAGFSLVAKITASALRELGIRRGRKLHALFKAWSIRLEVTPGPAPRFEIELKVRGPGGVFGADRLALLEQIDRTGSISEAARGIGITYRSAWLWTREMRRVWGRALLIRTTGGRGGGGASLTSEGKRLLEAALTRMRASGPDERPTAASGR